MIKFYLSEDDSLSLLSTFLYFLWNLVSLFSFFTKTQEVGRLDFIAAP